jgi:hypothetical protein
MTFDASNRKQVRSREKELKIAEANRLAYTRTIMSDKFGRRWMYDVLERCHIGMTPFVVGRPDVSDFNCGEQNIGLQFWRDCMAAAPAEYVIMMNEASIKEAVNDRRYSDDRSTEGDEHSGGEGSGRDDQGSILTEYDPTVPDA